jgi:hypothetical protein
MSKVRSLIAQMQLSKPGRTFQSCWAELQRDRPELFEQSPIGLPTSPAKTVSELVADFLSTKPTKPRSAAVVHASQPMVVCASDYTWDRS